MEHYIITIARGFGSGGKEIGNKLAKRLGIPCYESQILKMASEYSGINESLFYKADEKLTQRKTILGYLKKVPFTSIAEPYMKEFTSDVNLFNIQKRIIETLAKSQSCVIVGKCADYVLQDFPNVVSAYIEAPRTECVDSIVKKLGVSREEADQLIEKTDRYRAAYYRYYTGGAKWTNPVNYDLTLNSARVGRENCVDVLEWYTKKKQNL
ncbi:cytidylate kinase-like family protein [Hespellia stercorisuis]|uniref:Cytidylate kinase n=1 Tax=Hespellia stercorisuis DSM 15480 TaxID=1121950 RepID=A0A1M6JZL7_9FIRM|nr:cytidylate kinase-like family protein [Hespellia stercorisuis]SHJ52166.1 Cytidylate kinase [Hespellia stercorisuis DSM 15480]